MALPRFFLKLSVRNTADALRKNIFAETIRRRVGYGYA